jgi:hypothetical protein
MSDKLKNAHTLKFRRTQFARRRFAKGKSSLTNGTAKRLDAQDASAVAVTEGESQLFLP